MRKLLFISNAMLVSIIIFMSCNKQDSISSTSKESLAANGKGPTVKPCPDCFDYTPVGFEGVNAAAATTISQNYKLLNQPLLTISDQQPDANSIWFSLESLKNFIWKIEEAACKSGCGNGLHMGIRLYYGKYPTLDNMGPFGELDMGFAERHTIFMVPTFQDNVDPTVQWDFDPWHWGPPGCRPITMRQWFSTSPKPFGVNNSLIFSVGEQQYFMEPNGTLSSAMNHGNLIPPFSAIGTAY